jgi:hypothetical protein
MEIISLVRKIALLIGTGIGVIKFSTMIFSKFESKALIWHLTFVFSHMAMLQSPSPATNFNW